MEPEEEYHVKVTWIRGDGMKATEGTCFAEARRNLPSWKHYDVEVEASLLEGGTTSWWTNEVEARLALHLPCKTKTT